MHTTGVPLSADERLREVAPILAAGLMRLDQRAALRAEESPENLLKEPPDDLEFSARGDRCWRNVPPTSLTRTPPLC